MDDRAWMRLALEEAKAAAALGEVPVGALVVRSGELIAKAHNRRETGKSALAHAECLAIDEACKTLGGWRLHECELYVTLEPCPMCAGAIINSRLRRVVYGARDPKAGCCGSVTDLFALPFNHRPEAVGGVLEEECAGALRAFFQAKRKGAVNTTVTSEEAQEE
ncbi:MULTISPECIES: nucleoside deaminase [Oscillospiraceae]|uniref:tRNA-specific adenosine deaminase n=1 Tax=Harryflintia acetispora TaxID=1849041 RepID=A0A9X8UM63_9FIRM|nr:MULTISPECIES: nucleoside deaminase [Oscillospiraceae]RGB68841.1 nucleoside deaminase [Harryflintia acetispora]TCL45332.1 tRNA(adenine34) deaminase [Harryflintia acetispora]